MSNYRVDVLGVGSTHWANNALRFDTADEALAYGKDLYGRWTGSSAVRVVPADYPERTAYMPGTEDYPAVLGTTTKVLTRPNCDVHKAEGIEVPALYDGKTVHGPWAFMCQTCFDTLGVGLGTGLGQALLTDEETK